MSKEFEEPQSVFHDIGEGSGIYWLNLMFVLARLNASSETHSWFRLLLPKMG